MLESTAAVSCLLGNKAVLLVITGEKTILLSTVKQR